MDVFVAICTGCHAKIGVPRPGSIGGGDEIVTECHHCGGQVFSNKGFTVEQPKNQEEEFDLLSVE